MFRIHLVQPVGGGIEVGPKKEPPVGDLAFGTHFCQFYRSRQDLIDTLVPFFVAGLRHGEACMWVTSDPLRAHDAREAMRAVLPDLDGYVARGQIEICDYQDWYLTNSGTPAEVLQGWLDREKRALAQGFNGLRLTGLGIMAAALGLSALLFLSLSIFGALEIPLTTAGAFAVIGVVLVGAGTYLWIKRT